MARDADQLASDTSRWKDVVGATCVDNASRHAVVLRRTFILGERHTTLGLNFRHSQGTVAAQARENNADRAIPLLLGERSHEEIYGHRRSTRLNSFLELQRMIRDGHRCVGRDHIYVVRFEAHALRHLHDRHRGLLSEHGAQKTFMLRIQVLNQHESHSCIGGKIRQ